ncbi:MAG: bifunctional 2-polyprenyl-6-hydroxyphenol methylase/3-demethylubiquinol 3-O-methyltransferase UbiG, partial [Cyanobacteria bacterium P01_F01_bin.3]
ANRGAQVTGIDQSARCITAAKQHASAANLSIDYQPAHSENLPFDAETFDIVVCVDVLEHVADLPQTILEISRVIKPNGLFLFDTINRTWQSKLVMIWLLENTLRQIPCGVHDWNKFITPAELSTLLTASQLQPTAIAGFDLFGKGILGKWNSLWRYWQTGQFQVNFDVDADRIMYIGVGQKTTLEE